MRISLSSISALAASLLVPNAALAHDDTVHRDMTDLAYEIMLAVAIENNVHDHRSPLLEPIANVSVADWEAFLADVVRGRDRVRTLSNGLQASKQPVCAGTKQNVGTDWAFNLKLKDMPSAVGLDWFTGNDCGVDAAWTPTGFYREYNARPGERTDFSGQVLGMWSATIDDHTDDTHLYYKITSMGGLGAVADKADSLIDKGLALPLIPLWCLFECFFGDCDECDQNARDFADSANPTDEILGLLPGVGDVSNPDWVGVWHFIETQAGAPTDYDDQPGEVFEHSGPSGQPDMLTLTLIATFDGAGLSLNWDDSAGPKQFQILSGGDFHRDTRKRSAAVWSFPTVGHLIFEPADNLAHFGWARFRQLLVSAEPLSWPLHAIQDATVPMHVVGSSGWGHRPYEDAIQDEWPQLVYLSDDPAQAAQARQLQLAQAHRILERAYHWRRQVLDWRATHAGQQKNVPVRDLVSTLARQTLDYSLAQQPSGWPFDPGLSISYLFSPVGAQESYATRRSIDQARPLIENGVGATLAFLISAMER